MVVFDLYPLAQGDQYWTIDPGRFLQPAQQHAGKEEIISPANNHYLGQFPFVPFFAGQRMCPAFAVTEVLFKVILAKLVADYELQFVNNGDGDFTLHIEPKFKFPELIQYALIP
jgi:cytochrome P450